MKKGFFLACAAWLLPLTSFAAQTEVAKSWNTVTFNIKHNNYRFYLEPQLRIQDAPNKLDQVLNNVGLGYLITPTLTLWAGTTSLIIGSLSDEIPHSREFRIWQQISTSHKIQQYDLQWRTRLEERKREHFSDLNYRLRTRLTVEHPFYKVFSVVWYDEFFINLNRPIWITSKRADQNRFFIGMDYQATKTWTVGLGYLNQYIFTKLPIIGHVASLHLKWENN
ncbi:Protein of uncharacterised function (DUF2490) [Legionella busanensis]|uniref:Protein of uncharacterized function (DUF2490) n=1 Tax=Legionella busanensis TaxID=190655 RepID=A0A378JLP7_9GAMM|nr:DUF2490 domain-containing protein [Legionella busanensis]STX51671.1 Protein of uncharacterised function (DUF2490) [Legionella busanensis]